jgi:uncharacterized protein
MSCLLKIKKQYQHSKTKQRTGTRGGERLASLTAILAPFPKKYLLRYNFYTMHFFEFDAAKSKSNLAKHGIDFIDAQLLWDDPMLLEIAARTADEPRYVVIGLIDDKHWSAVITYRGDNIRLISVRRARVEEVALYES